MRTPMLRLFIAAILLLLPISSTSLGQRFHDPWDNGEHEHTAAKVWVNTKSGKYFYPGSRWYGKTKSGRYMSEQEARAKGYKMAQGSSN